MKDALKVCGNSNWGPQDPGRTPTQWVIKKRRTNAIALTSLTNLVCLEKLNKQKNKYAPKK